MIEKIEIKDTATYKNETIDNLSKINFIYGNNGSGKTTISRIIRDESKYPACTVNWKDNTKLETLVYNSDFVEDNFQPSQEIKGIFTLGKEEADTQKKIDLEKSEIEKLNKELSEIASTLEVNNSNNESAISEAKETFWRMKQDLDKSSIKNALSGVRGKMDDFFNRVLKEYSENKAELKNKEELEEISQKCYLDPRVPITLLNTISFNVISELEKESILDKVIIGKEDLDVSALIKELKNSDWVKSGMKYISSQKVKCPFCQQDLPKDLENKLNSYFDKTYENDKRAVELLKKNYETETAHLISSLKDIIDSQLKELDTESLRGHLIQLQKVINSNNRILEKKVDNLSQKYKLTSISEFDEKINAIIHTANEKIQEHNDFIKNLTKEKKNLEPLVWKYICNELDSNISKYNNQIESLNKEKNDLETEQVKKTSELDKHKEELKQLEKKLTSVQPTLDSINKLLSDFNFTGFRLAQGNTEYTYKIERLDGTPVEKTLSEGEKSFVTFLYFYNLLNGSQSSSGVVNKRIVVIDDPVSSLDNDILFIVSTLIRMMFNGLFDDSLSIKQLFILTHNLYFFKEVSFDCGWNKSEKNKLRFWTINKLSNLSHINSYEKNNPIKTSYELLWDIIRQTEEDKTKYDCIYLQNTMRRILEYYFKMLGNNPIRTQIDEFEINERPIYKALISWINIGSHSQMEEIFYNERTVTNTEIFLSVFKKIFEKTNQIDHYNMMMKIEGAN